MKLMKKEIVLLQVHCLL